MKRTEISYRDLLSLDPAYVVRLRRKESVLRRTLNAMDRHDTSVRWSCIDDGSGNYVFRLVTSEDPNDWIIQVSPLDLTREADQFEQLLAEGKRSCVSLSCGSLGRSRSTAPLR